MKRIFSLMLALCLTILLVCVSADGYIPESTSEYKDDFEILFITGILTADKYGNFPLDTTVTRKELCYSVARMMNIIPNETFRQVFTDVTDKTEFAAEIYALYDMGIIKGKGNGIFEPGASVTFEEMITVLVRVLGYEEKALVSGGWPAGYYITANNLGMLKGTGGVFGATVTKFMFAKVLANTVDLNVSDIVKISDNGEYRKETSRDTVLSRYHDIGKITGTVVANEYTATGTLSAGDNRIVLGNKVFWVGDTDISLRLGYKCDVYYNITGENVICYRINKGVSYIEILPEQEPCYSGGSLCFYDNRTSDKLTQKAIPVSADIIYNNKIITAFNDEHFNIEDGKIVLVDNNSDGSVETVIINKYETLVVDMFNLDGQKLYLKNSSRPMINLSAIDYEIYDAEGKHIDGSYVREWGVLSLAMSEDNSIAIFYLSEDKILGEVTSVSGNEVEVGGNIYEYCSNFTSDFTKPNPGDVRIFYFNISGKIAAIKNDPVAMEENNIGYIVAKEYKGGFENCLDIKILTSYGTGKNEKFIIDCIKESIVIDGERFKPSEADARLDEIEDEVGEMIVLFKVDALGKISSINTLHHEPDESEETEIYESFSPEAAHTWRNGKTFDGMALVRSDAEVFFVPSGGGDDSVYAITTTAAFINDTVYEPIYKTYKIGKDSIDDSIVIMDKSAGADTGVFPTYMDVSVVQRVFDKLDEEEEYARKAITYNTGGVDNTVFAGQGVDISGLSAGDIIKVSLNVYGELDDYQLLFDMSDNNIESPVPGEMYSNANYHNAARSMYGYVYRINGNALMITKYTPTQLLTKRAEFEAEENATEDSVERKMEALCEKHYFPGQTYVWDRSADKNNLQKTTAKQLYSFKDYGAEASRVYIYSIFSVEEFLMEVK